MSSLCGPDMCSHLDVCYNHQQIDGEPVFDALHDLVQDIADLPEKDAEFVGNVYSVHQDGVYLSEGRLKWIRDIYRRTYG